jgi:hypothetical protein
MLRRCARSEAALADVSLGPEACCWNGDGCIGCQGLLVSSVSDLVVAHAGEVSPKVADRLTYKDRKFFASPAIWPADVDLIFWDTTIVYFEVDGAMLVLSSSERKAFK